MTVKHRIGIDRIESYEFVRDFVGTVAAAGCEVFIVHARNAWLQGLSPKENREVPPLRYEFVTRLQNDFSGAGLRSTAASRAMRRSNRCSGGIAGAMVGREAYHHPGCWPNGIHVSSARKPWSARASRSRPRWSTTWSARHALGAWSRIARHMLGCGTASSARAAGARCSRTTG